MYIYIQFALLVTGIFLLVKGADYLIESSSSIAKSIGVSELVIGLTIVALATSLPEFAVGVFASSLEHSEISVSNIIGSNIYNICIIIGLLAIFRKRISDHTEVIHREITVLLLVTGAFTIVSFYGLIDAAMGVLFLSFLIFYLLYLYSNQKHLIAQRKQRMVPLKDLLVLVASMVVIYIGAKATVDSAINIAVFFALPEWLIGATIIAAGTSFPETVVSIVALKKRKFYLSLGNIIGSNIFNILAVIGFAAILNPIVIDFSKYFLDYVFLVVTAIFISFVALRRRFHQSTAVFAFTAYVLYVLMVLIRR